MIVKTQIGQLTIDKSNIVTVKSVDEVLKIALTKELKPIEWVEVETLNKSDKDQKTPASRH